MRGRFKYVWKCIFQKRRRISPLAISQLFEGLYVTVQKVEM